MTLARQSLSAGILLFLGLPAWGEIPSTPSTAQGWVDLSHMAYDKAELDEAEDDLKQALTLDPGNTAALYAQGLVQAKLKNWPEALASFRSAAQADPSNPKAWLGWGWASEKTGNSDQAIQCYQKVLQLGPEPQDQILAQKRLSHLGVPLSASAMNPTSPTAPVPAENQEGLGLVLGTEDGFDDDLNSSSPLTKTGHPAAQDGFYGLTGHLKFFAPIKDGHWGADLIYGFKGYFTQTGFNGHDLSGRTQWEAPLAPSLRGRAGLGGDLVFQNDGFDYSSENGWAGLEFAEGSAKVSASYRYRLETFNVVFNQDFDSPVIGPGQGNGYVNPNAGSHQVDLIARERLSSWLTLSAQYRFRDNQATGLVYDYVANSVGGGVELFLFSADHLIGGLQVSYLNTSRPYRDESALFSLITGAGYPLGPTDIDQKDNVDCWTVQGDWDLREGLSVSLYYRYENNSSNIALFSYTDHLLGASLSYDLL